MLGLPAEKMGLWMSGERKKGGAGSCEESWKQARGNLERDPILGCFHTVCLRERQSHLKAGHNEQGNGGRPQDQEVRRGNSYGWEGAELWLVLLNPDDS